MNKQNNLKFMTFIADNPLIPIWVSYFFCPRMLMKVGNFYKTLRYFGFKSTLRYYWHKLKLFLKTGTFNLRKQGLIETKREYRRLQKDFGVLIISDEGFNESLKRLSHQLDELVENANMHLGHGGMA